MHWRTVVAVSVLGVGCSTAPSSTADGNDNGLTTRVTTTSTVVTTTTTRAAETTTTTESDATAVFDSDALEELVNSIVIELGIEDLGPVPVPDLTNPDPVAAMRSRDEFGDWVHTTYPHPAWAPVFAAPDSPALRNWTASLTRIFGEGARFVFTDEGWTRTGYRELTNDDVDFLFRSTLPRERWFVAFDQTFGDYQIRSLDDDAVISEHAGQSTDGIVYAVVPTELGWQVWSASSG